MSESQDPPEFVVGPDGSIQQWRFRGVPIIYPERLLPSGKIRGGAAVCAPLFGPMPEELRRFGLDLPQHGLIRQTTLKPTSSKTIITCLGRDHTPDGAFEWHFNTDIIMTHGSFTDETRLVHCLSVQNLGTHPEANITDPMPCSLGFHPYFATHGQFQIIIDGQTFNHRTLTEGRPEGIPLGQSRQVILMTERYQVKMSLATEYDGVYLWSDDFSSYICVEPVARVQHFGDPEHGLPVGASRAATCWMSAQLH